MNILYYCVELTIFFIDSALDSPPRYTFFLFKFALYLSSTWFIGIRNQLIDYHSSLNLFSRDRFYTGLEECYGSLPYLPDR